MSNNTNKITTNFNYDEAGNAIKEADIELDANGEVQKRTEYYEDGNLVKNVYYYSYGKVDKSEKYDKKGRVTETVKYDKLGGVTETVNFFYEHGKREVVYNERGKIIKDYDELGRLESEERSNEQGKLISVTEYQYDKQNNVIKTIQCEYEGEKKIAREYDGKGVLHKTTECYYDEESVLHEVIKDYDSEGILKKETMKDSDIRFQYEDDENYDPRYSVIYGKEIINEYDGHGNLIKRIEKDATASTHGRWTEREYDAKGCLIKTMYIEYDSKGNIINNIEEHSHTPDEIAEGVNPTAEQIEEIVGESLETPKKENKTIVDG